MSNQESVIDRIRKLMALAEKNSNVNEAATAAAMAQSLLFKHKLCQADIQADDEPEDALGTADFDTPGHLWRKSLVHGISRAFYCRAVTLSGKRKTVRIVGKLSDTQSVIYLAQYLINEIETLAKGVAGQGKAYVNAFKVGCVATIIARLDAQRKEQDRTVQETASESTALVLKNDAVAVSRYFHTLFPKTVKGRGPVARDGGGYEAGKQAGANVSLGGGRGLSAKTKQIGDK
jgi:hypothetical protein